MRCDLCYGFLGRSRWTKKDAQQHDVANRDQRVEVVDDERAFAGVVRGKSVNGFDDISKIP